MSDLVAKYRKRAKAAQETNRDGSVYAVDYEVLEILDRIEALKAENARLRKAITDPIDHGGEGCEASKEGEG